jgi:hypothetical protein
VPALLQAGGARPGTEPAPACWAKVWRTETRKAGPMTCTPSRQPRWKLMAQQPAMSFLLINACESRSGSVRHASTRKCTIHRSMYYQCNINVIFYRHYVRDGDTYSAHTLSQPSLRPHVGVNSWHRWHCARSDVSQTSSSPCATRRPDKANACLRIIRAYESDVCRFVAGGVNLSFTARHGLRASLLTMPAGACVAQ